VEQKTTTYSSITIIVFFITTTTTTTTTTIDKTSTQQLHGAHNTTTKRNDPLFDRPTLKKSSNLLNYRSRLHALNLYKRKKSNYCFMTKQMINGK